METDDIIEIKRIMIEALLCLTVESLSEFGMKNAIEQARKTLASGINWSKEYQITETDKLRKEIVILNNAIKPLQTQLAVTTRENEKRKNQLVAIKRTYDE